MSQWSSRGIPGIWKRPPPAAILNQSRLPAPALPSSNRPFLSSLPCTTCSCVPQSGISTNGMDYGDPVTTPGQPGLLLGGRSHSARRGPAWPVESRQHSIGTHVGDVCTRDEQNPPHHIRSSSQHPLPRSMGQNHDVLSVGIRVFIPDSPSLHRLSAQDLQKIFLDLVGRKALGPFPSGPVD